MSRIPYASIIGSLIYTMLYTRSDIIFTVSIMNRYQSNPDEEHWIAVKNILKYLKRIKDLFLIFERGSELRIKGYTDSDFISDLDDRKSTSRYMSTCNDGIVS